MEREQKWPGQIEGRTHFTGIKGQKREEDCKGGKKLGATKETTVWDELETGTQIKTLTKTDFGISGEKENPRGSRKNCN